MELSSSDKERIQHQYDALAKKTLVGEAKSHRRTLALRDARVVTLSDLRASELLNVVRTTVFRHRKSALAKIKLYLEGKADDEHR